MSPQNLIQWLKNPAQMDRDSLAQLSALLDEYPCFTIARTLYLKNLLLANDLRFSKELIRTAISVPDRRRLYYFIEDKTMPEPVYSHEKELSSGEGFSIIDRFLHSTSKDAGLEFPVADEVEDKSDFQSRDIESPDKDDEPLYSAVQPESSFSLDYVCYLNQTMQDSDAPPEISMPGQDLIDAFLEQESDVEHKTDRLQHTMTGNLEKEDVLTETGERISEENPSVNDLSEDTFTETLAKIYLKQKRYDHALEIFKSLSLKYPEKNVYFADQIRFLEKLIINIKNN